MIHVALVPADEYGCGHYRMRLPGDHSGAVVEYHERAKLRTSNDLKTASVVLRHVDVNGADVAVFQRPMDHRLVPVIEQLKRQGVATVVELDDNLAALDPRHVGYRASHPTVNPLINFDHLRRACKAADLVTVSTSALARAFGGHGRCVVIPNMVDEALLEINEPFKRAMVGWTGMPATHPGDLAVLGGSIAELLRDYGVSFGTIGDPDETAKALGMDPLDIVGSGWLDLDAYYRLMAAFAVGVVPLRNSAFNHSKSDLKGLEFAALGVPFVASPLPEYQALASRGVGRLATKPKRWRAQIRELLTGDRTEVIEAGRTYVREHRTIQGQAWRWLEAWEDAITMRTRRAGKVAA